MLDDENTVSTRLLIELYAASPIILLPMSTQSTSVLVVDLGKLTVKNQLLLTGDPGTMRKSADPDRGIIILFNKKKMFIDFESYFPVYLINNNLMFVRCPTGRSEHIPRKYGFNDW
jgi:hypothetical protein